MKDFTYFEYSSEISNKFWGIKQNDDKIEVHFGRIGTKGQSKGYKFFNADTALKEYNKLIKEKTNKGYKPKVVGKKYTVKLVTRIVDNQDGGFTAYAYNNEEEMLADHPALEDLDQDSEDYQKKVKEILDEDDEYENGYIGSDSFEIEISNSQARLVGHLSFHGGQ